MVRVGKSLDELQQLLEDKLAQSKLTLVHAGQLGLELMDGETAGEELKIMKTGGIKIPYFDLAGKETEFWRFRFLEPTKGKFDGLTDKKSVRYTQAKGSLNQLYFPPLVDWAAIKDNISTSIVITEGELKAACACSVEIPTIGLGGVWCFKSNNNHMNLLPQFHEIKWEGRSVYICYDSDAISNHLVMMAENALAKELLNLGAMVHITRMIDLAPPAKTGLDDFICSEGTRAFVELIGSSTEWRASQELFLLNEEVVYVRDPGVVMELATLQRMTPVAFYSHAYATRRFFEEIPAGKGKIRMVEKSAAAEWIKWPCRSEVGKTTYAPGQQRIVGGALNVWLGWGCLPAEGDVSPWSELLDYLFIDSPQETRDWFERWLAYPIQNPGEKMFTTVAMWGTLHGTGKSLIGYTMFKIYGKNATEIGDQNLHSSFNSWSENRQFIMGDEITGGDKRLSADRMKSMITQKQLRINIKFIPEFTVPDCVNYYFTSNHPDSFFLEDNDRRFFVHEVNRKPLPDAFYQRYIKWMESSGPNALFYHLLCLDLGGFQPQVAAPMTQSKSDMISSGRSDIGAWVAQLRAAPEVVLQVGSVVLEYCLFTSSELHSVYDQRSPGKVTINGVARELARANFPKVCRGLPVNTNRGAQRLWLVRPIEGYEEMTSDELSSLYHAERGVKCKTVSKF